jgi:hypothetical protein
MKGVISLTDWDWFQFLRAQPALDEVNFWRPSDTHRPHLAPGTPFIFKLSQKHGGWIVGFGMRSSARTVPRRSPGSTRCWPQCAGARTCRRIPRERTRSAA